MKFLEQKKLRASLQFTISAAIVLGVALICYPFRDIIGYRVVALALMMAVSFIAMLFDILPVLLAAILSAVLWNFLFIPPLFTFAISNTEDLLMFLLYFVIALVNVVLTFKIRQIEKKAKDKEEKENAIKLYNTLLNSLSHELRTPIATILGSVDTLKESGEKLSEANKAELLNAIGISSLRLNRQVENILNMSRLESGMLKPKKDWCDMNELVFSVIHKLSPVKNQHIIKFTPDENMPLFRIDEGFMEQVIYNLLHNAIQYTPEQSIISLEVKYIDKNCNIIVSDNGPGLTEKDAGMIFEKFYRGTNSKTGGSGLGLSIVKGFVEAQGGSVTLVKSLNRGTTFNVLVPSDVSYINSLNNE